ncbi:phage late control D family protein, partial [Lishizhenia sp.]|uniref:phage late control D family protein n=1 Tax=Lishizhenia sp. TaxID=2497594 RepID=UPI0029B69D59|nr:Rhs element Vgr protein [Lishizhenia sp.]
MATSPLTQESDLTSFTILSNGKEIPATYKVVSLKTVHELNRIAAAEIVLLDGDTSTQNFKVADSSTFIPGSEIEIKLGYHSKNDTVFKGLVMKQHIKISHGEGSQLHIICKDKALKMTVTKKNRMYSKTTDSGIMQSLINSSGLSSEVLETTILHEEVVQDATTDWHFLINRAAIYGLVVHTDNGKVVVAKPKVSDSAVLEVEYGRDINECNITLDARFQYAEVKARSQAFNSQDFIEAISKEPIVNKQGNITGKKLSKVLDAKSYLLHL